MHFCTAKGITGSLPNLEDRFIWYFPDKYPLFPYISLQVSSNRRKIIGVPPNLPPIQTAKQSNEETRH